MTGFTEELEIETSWHYDVGVYHQFTKNIDSRISAYYVDVDNYEIFDSAGYYPTAYAYTLDWARYYGIELEFNSSFDKLTLFGNYAYHQTETADTDLPVFVWADFAPEHAANLGIRYKLLDKTLLTSDLRYVGEKTSEGDLTIDDYFTTDVGVEQTLTDRVKLLAYANNVFDEDYQEVYGYPMPGIIYGFQVKLTFF